MTDSGDVENIQMAKPNRSTRPSTADRVFVAELVDRLGLAKAATELGLSKLAVLNFLSGRGSYRPTIHRVQDARSRVA